MTYNLANDFDVTVADFLRLAARGLGHGIRLVTVPTWLAQLGLTVTKGVLALATGGGMSVVTTASLAFLTKDNPFTSDRARRELGWSPALRPEIAIPEAFGWWASQHRVRR